VLNVALFRKSAQIAGIVDQAGLDQEFDTFRCRQGVDVVQQIWPNRDWKCGAVLLFIGRVAGRGRMILGASRWRTVWSPRSQERAFPPNEI
jgi:hypothetical protein